MTEPLISIIIPAYNAEKFLEQAVNSVKQQAYKNWEILIIENGSSDKTTNLSEKLVQKDKIALFHSEKGVSQARNMGIKKASGEWILFLDADDKLEKDALVTFEKKIEEYNGVDLIIGQYYQIKRKYTETDRHIITKREINTYMAECMYNPTQECNSTAVLFKKDVIIKNNIWFDCDLSHAEDSLFFLNVLIKSREIVCVDSPVYYVYYNSSSAVRSANSDLFEKYADSIKKIQDLLKEQDLVVKNAIPAFVLNQVLIVLVNNTFAVKTAKLDIKSQFKNARMILENPMVETAANSVDLSKCGKSRKVAFIAIKNQWIGILFFMSKVKQILNKKRNII